MKKLLALLLAALMVVACASALAEADADLVAAAKEEGELTVYGSCEEDYLNAACDHFEELYGIKVNRQRLSYTGPVRGKSKQLPDQPVRGI